MTFAANRWREKSVAAMRKGWNGVARKRDSEVTDLIGVVTTIHTHKDFLQERTSR